MEPVIPSITRTLRRAVWRDLRIWGHELIRKHERRLLARLRRAGLSPQENAKTTRPRALERWV